MSEEQKFVSEREAEELVASGEWSRQSIIRKRLDALAWQKLNEAAGILDVENRTYTMHDFLVGLDEADNLLRERFELRKIRPRQNRDNFEGLQILVGTDAVFKVVPAMHEGLFKILGIIVALLAFTNIRPCLGVITVGLGVREFVKVIVSAWERLEDPTEKQVFEAVFTLHGKLTIVNFDALQREDFVAAYGHLWPLEHEIVEYCASLPSEETRKTLKQLRKRKVLRTKDGRWSIQF
jgi:hypothetical protein